MDPLRVFSIISWIALPTVMFGAIPCWACWLVATPGSRLFGPPTSGPVTPMRGS